MELRPPTATIDDPFFAAVRRRHRDVDVVLLPPPAAPEHADPVSDDVVTAALAAVATEARLLWSAAGAGPADEPDARVAYGGDPASVRVVARGAVRGDDGPALLARLRSELAGRGWDLQRPRGAGVDRLTGRRAELELSASYAGASETFLLTLSSASMPVGIGRARQLTTAGGR